VGETPKGRRPQDCGPKFTFAPYSPVSTLFPEEQFAYGESRREGEKGRLQPRPPFYKRRIPDEPLQPFASQVLLPTAVR